MVSNFTPTGGTFLEIATDGYSLGDVGTDSLSGSSSDESDSYSISDWQYFSAVLDASGSGSNGSASSAFSSIDSYSLDADGTNSLGPGSDEQSTLSYASGTFETESTSISASLESVFYPASDVESDYSETASISLSVSGWSTVSDGYSALSTEAVESGFGSLTENESYDGGATFTNNYDDQVGRTNTYSGNNITGYDGDYGIGNTSSTYASGELVEVYFIVEGAGGLPEDASEGDLLYDIEDDQLSWAYSSPASTDQIEALVESGTLYLSSARAIGGSSITIPDAVPSYLTGSTLSLGEDPAGSFLSGLTFGFTPSTNSAEPVGLPNETASVLANLAVDTEPPDGVSRSAPPSPTATLTALAAAGRNPTDITIPTVGSQAGGDDDEDDVSSDGTSAAPSSGGVTADGEGEGGGGGSAPGSHLTPEQARAAEFAVMMPGDPTPADYEGYGPGVAKTAKGYYINGPVNMVVGTASALYNHRQTAAAIGNALRHPINTAAAVKEAVVAKFESGAEGQGEVLFNAALSLRLDPRSQAR